MRAASDRSAVREVSLSSTSGNANVYDGQQVRKLHELGYKDLARMMDIAPAKQSAWQEIAEYQLEDVHL